MKKTLITLILMVLATHLTFGQELSFKDTLIKRNSLYVEFFGQGLNGSVNFDRLYNLNKKIKSAATIGLVYVPRIEEFGEGTYLGVPLSYNLLFGKRHHHFEIGLGLTLLVVTTMEMPVNSKPNIFYSYFTPKVGYRFQKPKGGLFVRVTATPMISIINHYTSSYLFSGTEYFKNVAGFGYRAFPWPGISLGYTIKNKTTR